MKPVRQERKHLKNRWFKVSGFSWACEQYRPKYPKEAPCHPAGLESQDKVAPRLDTITH